MPAMHSDLSNVFGALADPTRLAIVERLLNEGERTVGEIAEPFDMSMPAVSKHLGVLERAGVIERRVVRQWRVCRIRPEALRTIDEWVEHYRSFWDASLDRLAKLIEDNSKNRGKETK